MQQSAWDALATALIVTPDDLPRNRKSKVLEELGTVGNDRVPESIQNFNGCSGRIATGKDWWLVCDEKRVFRRKALELLGEDRLLTTPGIIVLCIRQGLLSVERADKMKSFSNQKDSG
jgi:hypothetical protein